MSVYISVRASWITAGFDRLEVLVYVCVCVYVFVLDGWVCEYVYVYLCVFYGTHCMCRSALCICVHTYLCAYIFVFASWIPAGFDRLEVCVYVCVCICVCVHMCV